MTINFQAFLRSVCTKPHQLFFFFSPGFLFCIMCIIHTFCQRSPTETRKLWQFGCLGAVAEESL